MAEREQNIPDWAERERAGDLAWIQENLHIFWPAARLGYETVGRGAIVVDTTSRPTGEGHPFGYLDQAAVEQSEDADTLRMVREYNPSGEFVAALLKSQDRTSSYRVGVISPETRENISRVDKPGQVETPLEQPDLETMMQWQDEGGCEAACPHHCWVEPDGTCEHDNPSWLLKLGLI